MRFVLVAIFLVFCSGSLAYGDIADDIRICSLLSDAGARLSCFDLAAHPSAPTPDVSPTPQPEATPEPAASPAPVAPPEREDLAKAREVKRLSPADLAVETHKWEGKLIETSLNCFYADVNQYRCFDVRTNANLRVDFTNLDPAGADYLEHHCDTLTIANGRGCYVKLRFRYKEYSRENMGGLMGNITFIQSYDYYGLILK